MRISSLGTAALLLVPGMALLGVAPALADASLESHAVIAVIDTGINPYHREFREPGLEAHPSTFVRGYPAGAEALDLCLDARPGCDDLRATLQHDAAEWQGVTKGVLYHVPGTRIIGAVSVGPAADPYVRPTRLFDDYGHGTATASLAAGATLGLCPACLLVVVEGPGDEALAWARAQPWIDIVANSWGWQLNLGWPPPPFGQDNAATTRAMVEQGQTVVFSAGNGVAFDTVPDVTDIGDYLLPGETTYTSEYTGPDWVVTVGAVDPANGQPVAGSARPLDVAAAGVEVLAASPRSRGGLDAFSGTSAAAPLVAGAFGHVLREARRALADPDEGPRTLGDEHQALAAGEPPAAALAGPLGDGVLTRAELQRLVFATAKPCPLDPAPRCEAGRAPWPFPARAWGWTLPTPPLAYPMLVGYGAVTEETRDAAVGALLGAPLAPRPEADLWARSDSLLRQRMWGSWDGGAATGDLLDLGV